MTLAKIFNIPINDLLADEGTPQTVADSKPNFRKSKKNSSHIYELSDKEKMLVGAFRASNPEEQSKILDYINTFINKK